MSDWHRRYFLDKDHFDPSLVPKHAHWRQLQRTRAVELFKSEKKCLNCRNLRRTIHPDAHRHDYRAPWLRPHFKEMQMTADAGCYTCALILRVCLHFGLLEQLKQDLFYAQHEMCGLSFYYDYYSIDAVYEDEAADEEVADKTSAGMAILPRPEPGTEEYHSLVNGDAIHVYLWTDYSDTPVPNLQLMFDQYGTQNVELYVLDEAMSPLGSIIPKQYHYPEVMNDPACFNLLESWISQCHLAQVCDEYVVSKLPTRVIDVGQDSSTVRLFSSCGAEASYTTLSHCWGVRDGPDFPLCTTKATEESHQKQIPWSKLGKLFQNAVEITRTIAVKYIWIDSLCIVQDDEKDWVREAEQMASIYENSYLSIMAPRGDDGSSGCFTNRYEDGSLESNPKGIRPFRLDGQSEDGTPFEVFARICPDAYAHKLHMPIGEVLKMPDENLFNRAWVFQEWMLAPRKVLYGLSELIWVCDHTVASEGWQECKHPQSKGDCSMTLRHPNIFKEWHQLVTNYSEKRLTFPEDRLPALSGLAKRIQKPGDEYLAGLWRSTLLKDLEWYPAERDDFMFSFKQNLETNSTPYIAPTWSWASYLGKVEFVFDDEAECLAEVLDAQCVKRDDDPTGRVASGFIKLRAPLLSVRIDYEEGYSVEYTLESDFDGKGDRKGKEERGKEEESAPNQESTSAKKLPIQREVHETKDSQNPSDGTNPPRGDTSNEPGIKETTMRGNNESPDPLEGLTEEQRAGLDGMGVYDDHDRFCMPLLLNVLKAEVKPVFKPDKDLSDSEKPYFLPSGTTIYALILGTNNSGNERCLVLQATSEDGVYHRIGYFEHGARNNAAVGLNALTGKDINLKRPENPAWRPWATVQEVVII